MNTKPLLSVLVAAATLGVAGATLAQSFNDQLLDAYGQFEIDPGQTKTLAHGKRDRAYRVCVHASKHGIPLKVMYDGQESVVYPGDCTDVEGMHVAIAPDEKLAPGMALFGRYERVRDVAPSSSQNTSATDCSNVAAGPQ